jgi:hypothetical protein
MPRVADVDGIEIEIRAAEHGSPHIHAWYQGAKVKLFIETLDTEKGALPPQQMKKLKKWVEANRDQLLGRWRAIVVPR